MSAKICEEIFIVTRYKIAGEIYWLNVVFLLFMGIALIFAPTFLPFHSEVVQTEWNEFDESYRTLYLGMMRTGGAGYLSSALAIGVLLVVPFYRREIWSAWAITAIGLTVHIPTLLANLHLARTTPATPPWYVFAACAFSLLLALGLLLSSPQDNPNGLGSA